MANVEIQGIEFQVVGEAAQAANGLKPLISSLKRLQRIAQNGLGLSKILQEIKDFNAALGKGQNPLSGLAESISEISGASRKLGSAHKHLSNIASLDFSNLTAAANAIGQIAANAGGLKGLGGRGRGSSSNLPGLISARDSDTEEMGGGVETGDIEDKFSGVADSVDSMFSHLDRDTILSFNRIDLLTAKLDILKRRMNEGLRLNGGDMNDKTIANLALQIKSVEDEIDKLNKKEIKLRYGNIMGQFAKILAIVKKVGSEFVKLGKTVGKFSANMLSFPFKKITADFKKAVGSVKQFLSSIGRIALYRLIRSAIAGITKGLKEGIEALDAYSQKAGTAFHKAMQSIKADANMLKGSLAACAEPIISAIAPALDFIASKIAYVLSLIAQLIAALTGKGFFTKVKKDVAAAGGAAGGAAKEIRMLISGFDELNAFSKSGGGGGGGGGGLGDIFETKPIDQEILDFAKRLKDAFEKGDWKLLGTLIGEKFNEIWDSIDWAGIGKKVGKGINGVIQTLYYALKTIDFIKMGRDLADMLNHALAEIDFNIAGRLLIRKFTAMLDMLVGFIQKADWGLIAKSIGDFLRGAFDEAAEWLASTDFAELGRILSDAVKKILDQLIDAAGHIPWEEFGNKLGDFLCNIDWGGILSRVATLIWEVAKGLIGSLFSTSGGRIFLAVWAGFKALSLIPLALKFLAARAVMNWVMAMVNPLAAAPGMVSSYGTPMLAAGKSVTGSLCLGILGAVGGIATAFFGIKDALMNGLNWLNGIIIPAGTTMAGAGVGAIIGSLGGPIGAGLGALIGLAVGLLTDLGIAIKEHWTEISAWIKNAWSDFTGWISNALSTIGNGILDGIGWIIQKGTELGVGIVNWVKTAVTDVGNWLSMTFTTIGNGLLDGIGWIIQKGTELGVALVNWIIETGTAIGTWISTTWNSIVAWTTTAWTNIKTTISTAFADAKNWVVTKANEIGTTISTTWNNVKTWTVNTWNNVKTSISTAFNSAKNTIVSTASTMKSNLSNTWNNIKSAASSAWESVKSTAISKWQTLSSTLSQKWSSLRTTLSSLDWTSVGRNLVEGLMNGVGGAWNALVEKVRSLANSLIAQIKSWFGIASPSKVFAEIGEYLDAGLEQGIEYGTGDLLATAKTLSNAVTNAMTPEFPSPDVWADDYSNILGDTGLTLEQDDAENREYGEEGNGYLAGIAQAVEQMFLFMRENNNNQPGDLKVVIDGREVFNVVVAENNRAIQRTGTSPIRV